MTLRLDKSVKEIQDDADDCEMVDAFYSKVRADDILGVIFGEAAGVDWGVHLPLMYRLWKTILLQSRAITATPSKYISASMKNLLIPMV